MEDIEQKVIEIVSEQMGVDKSEITRETHFINDLNADSLDTVELVMEFEDEFELSIPDEEAERSRPSVRRSTTSRNIPASKSTDRAVRREARPAESFSTAAALANEDSMARRRVVITGLGVVTSLGEKADEMWDKLCAGESGIGPIRRWDISSYPDPHSAANASTSTSMRYADESAKLATIACSPSASIASRSSRMAASISAVNDAGIDFDKEDRDPLRRGHRQRASAASKPSRSRTRSSSPAASSRVSPFTVPRLMANAGSGNVSILFHLHGPNTAVATACATGSNAIGDAGRLIQHDLADVMIAGGSEAALCELGMASFCAARAPLHRATTIRTHASRPWDKDRDGFVMAEGAGIVILEEYEHAKKRGARIYAELVGYGMSGDGSHITAPEPEGRGAALAMKLALKDAGVNADVVDYINAHGTSTPLGDLAETKAVKTTFGAHAKKLAISSTKSQLGHLLGASGGVEAVITSLAIHHNLHAANDQSRTSRRRVRSGLRPQQGPRQARHLRHEQQLRLRRA